MDEINRDLSKLTLDETRHLRRQRAKIGDVFLDRPFDDGELARIARRRSGMSQRAVAEQAGTSHVTMIKRERGQGRIEELRAFWERRGFRWPTKTERKERR